MHLTVKILNGEECTLAASPSSLVSDVKEQVEALMSIPVADQKLLFKGKALQDTKPLRDYGVEDSGKIILVVKKSVYKPTNTSSPLSPQILHPAQPEQPVWEKLRVFLQRHFRERDVEAVLQEFKKEFERNISSLSLDDIERLAITKLQQV
ncbi:ubiquitin-like protein 4A [Biomphalaria glabrata]|uniref:Ubiquitin-like protein 4A n=1 Tax=Biomphalaria glabrata TaxID=6526 RepID=A0A9W3A4L2_BIOGL|nr:ubiquitin-like protein 4A [Biomphalaria glabrata]